MTAEEDSKTPLRKDAQSERMDDDAKAEVAVATTAPAPLKTQGDHFRKYVDTVLVFTWVFLAIDLGLFVAALLALETISGNARAYLGIVLFAVSYVVVVALYFVLMALAARFEEAADYHESVRTITDGEESVVSVRAHDTWITRTMVKNLYELIAWLYTGAVAACAIGVLSSRT